MLKPSTGRIYRSDAVTGCMPLILTKLMYAICRAFTLMIRDKEFLIISAPSNTSRVMIMSPRLALEVRAACW